MSSLDDNIKMNIKLFSFLDLFLQNDTGQIGIFGKANEVVRQIKLKLLLSYCILFSCYNIHVLCGSVLEYNIHCIHVTVLSKVVAADTLYR